jgi:hypothetical protein
MAFCANNDWARSQAIMKVSTGGQLPYSSGSKVSESNGTSESFRMQKKAADVCNDRPTPVHVCESPKIVCFKIIIS